MVKATVACMMELLALEEAGQDDSNEAAELRNQINYYLAEMTPRQRLAAVTAAIVKMGKRA